MVTRLDVPTASSHLLKSNLLEHSTSLPPIVGLTLSAVDNFKLLWAIPGLCFCGYKYIIANSNSLYIGIKSVCYWIFVNYSKPGINGLILLYLFGPLEKLWANVKEFGHSCL